MHLSHFCLSNVFQLEKAMVAASGSTDPTESPSGKLRPEMRFSMAVRRYHTYYTLNLILPLFIISAISLCSFGCGRADLGDRLSVSTTMMLTAVAYKLIINADLPKLSYLTFIDKVSFANFAFISLVVLQNTLAAQWTAEGADRLDRACSIGFGGVLLLAAAWTTASAVLIRSFESSKMRAFKKLGAGRAPGCCLRCARCVFCASGEVAAVGAGTGNKVSPEA